MEASDIARYAFASIAVFLFVFVLLPYFEPTLPQQALIGLSLYSVTPASAQDYLVPGSLSFYTIWGALASLPSLVVDLLMFFGYDRR